MTVRPRIAQARPLRSRRPARGRRRLAAAATAGVALLVLGGGSFVLFGREGSCPAPLGPVAGVVDTGRRVDEALAPARRAGLELSAARLEFERGALPAADMLRRAEEAGARSARGRAEAARSLAELGPAEVFLASASLHVEAADTSRISALTDGTVRAELLKKAEREQRLADSVLDRAHALLGDRTAPPRAADMTGLEEGPPFAPPPPPRRALGPGMCQAISRWLPAGRDAARMVAERLTLQPLALQVFVDGGGPEDLRQTGLALARDVFAASDATLGGEPLPATAIDEAMALRAAFAVYEEMARSMNAATYVDGTARSLLVEKAKRQRLVGDDLFNYAAARLNDAAGLSVLEGTELAFPRAPASTYDPLLNGARGPFT